MQKANSISQRKDPRRAKSKAIVSAGRKDRRVEPLDEQRQANEDDGKATDQCGRAVRHALDEKHLENDDNDQRRRQIARCLMQELADDAQQRTHGRPFLSASRGDLFGLRRTRRQRQPRHNSHLTNRKEGERNITHISNMT